MNRNRINFVKQVVILCLLSGIAFNANALDERWVKKPNVAQYGGADWTNEVKRASGLSVEDAKRIAEQDPRITFFFYMRQYMSLSGKGNFRPGDAVFFSGKPWYGSAPQADAYEKKYKWRARGFDEVLLAGGWRTKTELSAMSVDDKRNTLIVELNQHSTDSISVLQGKNNQALAEHGLINLWLSNNNIRTPQQLAEMSLGNQRNTVIVEINKRIGTPIPDLQAKNNGLLLDIVENVQDTATSYTINLVNNTSSTRNFWLFLNPPIELVGDPGVFANSSINLQIRSNSQDKNQFIIPVQYVVGGGANNQAVGLNIKVSSDIAKKASLGQMWDVNYVSYPKKMGPTMNPDSSPAPSSTIVLKSNAFTQAKNENNRWFANMSFGIQTAQGYTGMTWSPEPSTHRPLTPTLTFYVATGDFGENQLAKWSDVSNNSATIHVPSDFKFLNTTVTLQNNGEWKVTPGTP